MQRRAFLLWLCAGIGASATTARALSAIPATPSLNSDNALNQHSGVATPEDVDSAKVENVWYGHWRRVNRRHYRRVSRRVYRRHY
jgi:hypothetical protein